MSRHRDLQATLYCGRRALSGSTEIETCFPAIYQWS